MKTNRCPYCPKAFQSRKDMHKHLKKIHDGDMTDADLDNLLRELTNGDVCNWKEENHSE